MQVDMSKFLYNENVMGDLDYYEDVEDVLVYDDSEEWYNNIEVTEADD